jgi:hypothetical protein
MIPGPQNKELKLTKPALRDGASQLNSSVRRRTGGLTMNGDPFYSETRQAMRDVQQEIDRDAGWSAASRWEKRCRELEAQVRLGPAYDLLHETRSLKEARAESAKVLAEIQDRISQALLAADAASQESKDADTKRRHALVAAQQAEALVAEIDRRLADLLRDAYGRGRKVGFLVQVGSGFVLGVLSSFLASWLFELYKQRILG